jgi:hypothetical protein
VNAIGNARSLARLYAALLGEVDGIRLLDEAAVAPARAPADRRALAAGAAGGPRVAAGTAPWARLRARPALGAHVRPAGLWARGAGGRFPFADPATPGPAIAFYTGPDLTSSIPDVQLWRLVGDRRTIIGTPVSATYVRLGAAVARRALSTTKPTTRKSR